MNQADKDEFLELDKDNSGTLDCDEVAAAAATLGLLMDGNEITHAMKDMDADGYIQVV